MLRDKSLIPLSHQHQHALALCVRIERAQPIAEKDLEAWCAEIETLVEHEIKIHFATEEDVVFPAARSYTRLISLIDELLVDHASLRGAFLQIEERRISSESLAAFAQLLSAHIRKEERQLFEGMQESMTAGELAALGQRLDIALKNSVESCVVPNEATQLKAKK
jgi:hemerythrin-like domain-containing protein